MKDQMIPDPSRQARAIDALLDQQEIMYDEQQRIIAILEQVVAIIKDPAAKARAVRSLETDLRALRAQRLQAEGLSAAQIGIRMAREDGRPDRPYSGRQVRKWRGRPTQT